MASQTESYPLAAPAEAAWAAVQAAARQSGWEIAATEKHVLQLKIPAMGGCNPATLVARVLPAKSGVDVEMAAFCYGLSTVMNAPLLGYIRTLHGLIDVQINALRPAPQNAYQTRALPMSGVLGELERLARLRAQNALSEEEFTLAKQRLLGK